MALNLTDDQLKTVSSEVLAIPAQIVTLNNQKTQAIAGKAEELKKDDANKVFYDNFKNILKCYYDEQKEIDGVTHTEYADNDLVNGAKQAPDNFHYPSTQPVWPNLQPKIVDSVKGLPTGTSGSTTEIGTLPLVQTKINELKNGFNDGAQQTTLFASYSAGQPLKTVGTGYVVGQRVIVDNAGVSLLGVITAAGAAQGVGGTCSISGHTTQASCEAATPTPGVWTPNPPLYGQDLTITVLAGPLGSLPAGSRVRNFFLGFSNAEREATVVSALPEVMTYMRGLIDTQVTIWKAKLNAEKTALNANTASGAEAGQITTAKNNVQSALDEIALFEGAPVTGLNVGRYGDNRLTPLSTKRSDRATQAPARVTEITTALGSVTQNPDGTFSGSGNFNSLFKWIDLRISKAGGSLFSYYNFDLILKFIDQKIVSANSKKSEFDNQAVVKKITVDPNGTKFITVDSTTNLSIGNSVKVLDNSATPILSTTIVGISGQVLELNHNVAGFTIEQIARVVKLL